MTKTIDFLHRTASIPDDGIDSRTLCDTVNMMVARADSVLACLSEVVENGLIDSLSINTHQNIINTVVNELRDIDAMVIAFHFGTVEKDKV